MKSTRSAPTALTANSPELPDPADGDFLAAALRLVHLRLDPLDLQIVSLLRQDGRMATREIARRCRMAEGPIRRRVARLLDEGIIRVTVLTEPTSVGLLLSALLLIKCRMDRMEAVSQDLADQPEVRYVAVVTGAYELIVEAFFYSRKHLTAFLTTRLAKMDGVIESQTSVVLDVAKLSYEWEIPTPAPSDSL